MTFSELLQDSSLYVNFAHKQFTSKLNINLSTINNEKPGGPCQAYVQKYKLLSIAKL